MAKVVKYFNVGTKQVHKCRYNTGTNYFYNVGTMQVHTHECRYNGNCRYKINKFTKWNIGKGKRYIFVDR